MNKIYLIGTEKGGAGKTSLSFNLAVMRAKAGVSVLLVDADKQASSSMWSSMRSEAGYLPPLVCMQKLGKIGLTMVQLKTHYEVIIESGGSDSVELRQGIAVADRWIIPVRPGQLDLFSMSKMQQLRLEVEERVGKAPDTSVVLNAVSPLTKEAEEARALLTDAGFDVLKTQIVDRVAMRKAVMSACAVVELQGKFANETASAELQALYEEIFGETYDAKA